MNKHTLGFATAGSIMTIIFLAIVNYITSPGYLWFVYPAFCIIWWPLTTYYIMKQKTKMFSIVGFLLITIFLALQNYIFSPSHPWILYAVYVLVWWPIFMYSGKKAGKVSFAVVGSICTIVYYTLLNIFLSSGFPWAVFPAFAVLWWPITLYFTKRKQFFAYSITGALLIAAFFISVNAITSPHIIWAVYPIFAASWWPLSSYYFVHSRGKMINKVKLLFLNNYRK